MQNRLIGRANNVTDAAQAQTLWGLFRERVRRSPRAVKAQ
jgi:hypothetical protein